MSKFRTRSTKNAFSVKKGLLKKDTSYSTFKNDKIRLEKIDCKYLQGQHDNNLSIVRKELYAKVLSVKKYEIDRLIAIEIQAPQRTKICQKCFSLWQLIISKR